MYEQHVICVHLMLQRGASSNKSPQYIVIESSGAPFAKLHVSHTHSRRQRCSSSNKANTTASLRSCYQVQANVTCDCSGRPAGAWIYRSI